MRQQIQERLDRSAAGLAIVRASDEGLELEHYGERSALQPVLPDLYVIPRPGGTFSGVGFLPGFVMVDEVPHRRLEVAVDTSADPSTWGDYEGVYQLNDPMHVRVAGDRLLLLSSFYKKETACVPLGGERFACEWGIFTFRRDQHGRVEGLVWGRDRYIPRKGRPA